MTTPRDDLFLWAQETPGVAWMSQNTNDLPTTPRIREAIQDALAKGAHHQYPYSKGSPGLPELILRDLGLSPSTHGVLVSAGAIEGLYALNRALVSPGDEMVSTDPSFLPIHHQVTLGAGRVVEVPIYDAPYRLTPETVAAKTTPKTKLVFVNDPINPMGTGYPHDALKGIVEVARDAGAVLVHDVTYRDFAREHTPAHTIDAERVVYAYSFSKSAGLAGLRIGALVAPHEVMAKVLPFNTNVLSVNVLAQVAAKAALETKREWLPSVVKTCRDNQAMIRDAVRKTEGARLPVYPSDANVFVIDVSGTGVAPEAIQKALLFDHKVFVRSGNYVSPKFGDRFVRVSFSVPPTECRRFCDAFPRVVDELRPP
ncbi:MAG: pyridoxal phosphate-dependent aminotransferase [Methanobacteriota archaeon]